MPFNLIHYSQQDPRWKDEKLGFGAPNETIGYVGSALTSVAMLLNGHGYAETPYSLNRKLMNNSGFMGAAIVWGAVSRIYQKISLKAIILCYDTDAPLDQIDAAIAGGQPVLVQVDFSQQDGLQTHWVMLYARQGDDYLMLDPWPYPTDDNQKVLLMPRYAKGKSLKRAITSVVMYENTASGGSVSAVTPSPAVVETDLFLRVPISQVGGLNLRSQPGINSTVVDVALAGARLQVIEPESIAEPKIGVYDQWIHVRAPSGTEGYIAAWLVYRSIIVAPRPAAGLEPVPGAGVKPVEAQVETSVSDAPKPIPEDTKLEVFVSNKVGSGGLAMRERPMRYSALVAMEPPGARLTSLEILSRARQKIGKVDQWLNVMDQNRLKGYIPAEFVSEAPAFISDSSTLTVFVSSLAQAGLSLRSGPSTNAKIIKVLPANSELTVMEPTGIAELKVGVYNQWLKVRDVSGVEGYVAAWYVQRKR
jgi:SH3-like domain-containing protein